MNDERKVEALRFAMEAVAEYMHECNLNGKAVGVDSLMILGTTVDFILEGLKDASNQNQD